jgi:phosphoglycerate dehydrogenase-like enzyme
MLRNIPGEYRDLLEAAGLEVVYPGSDQDTLQPETLRSCLDGIDAMLASTESMTDEVLAGSNLRVIARMGVGYDSIDIPAATKHNIAVTITPGVLEDSVAEHTMALMLAVSRGIVVRDREVRSGVWTRAALPRLTGKTFGLIGLGRIGRVVAQRAQGMAMQTMAYDPYTDPEVAAEYGVRLGSLEEVLGQADVVSVHALSSPETAKIINSHTLGLMKPEAIFINTSRGALVDEDALVAALKSGHLLGAALDTFEHEPPPTDHPLLGFENVVVCTHMGGLDYDSEAAASGLAAQCIAELFQGSWPERCVINRELGPDWKW